ncbi:MAG: hypothetical protein HQ461_13170 [Deltaproteobacteria bacterium]|nr:hypothetical protein [Deltaproteobacteria bacterium]
MMAGTSLQPLALLALCVVVGALLGRRSSWRVGGLLGLAAALVALLLQFLPGLPVQVVRSESLAWFAVAAVAIGAMMRAAADVGLPERGRWLAWLPLLGSLFAAFSVVAPVLLQSGDSPQLALASATAGTEQHTRDLLLPLVQPMALWVRWGWVVLGAATALVAGRATSLPRWLAPLLWMGLGLAVVITLPVAAPTQAAAEELARAALRPGEKVLSLLPLPAGPFVVEPNFFVGLLLLTFSGAAAALLATPGGVREEAGEAAARGLVVSLVAFAALTTARLSVGLALPTMVGMSGVLLVASLCFGAALFGQAASVRIASRLLLALLFLFPWLLWSSLGALP